ncbi:MAG: hypothetical protein AB7U75_15650 [Hyphomicrobiaceae bacterium]
MSLWQNRCTLLRDMRYSFMHVVVAKPLHTFARHALTLAARFVANDILFGNFAIVHQGFQARLRQVVLGTLHARAQCRASQGVLAAMREVVILARVLHPLSD